MRDGTGVYTHEPQTINPDQWMKRKKTAVHHPPTQGSARVSSTSPIMNKQTRADPWCCATVYSLSPPLSLSCLSCISPRPPRLPLGLKLLPCPKYPSFAGLLATIISIHMKYSFFTPSKWQVFPASRSRKWSAINDQTLSFGYLRGPSL